LKNKEEYGPHRKPQIQHRGRPETGLIVAMRILTLPDFSICSSVFFPFVPGKELRLQREWQKKTGIDRYAHLFKLSRKESIRMATREL
jgi:hypothetical protein